MLELLKKIGLPATVAAVIASFVTAVPLLFKIDERYAKEEDLQAQAERTEKVINGLTVEISRLAGTQQVLVTLLANQDRRAPIASVVAPTPVAVQAPVEASAQVTVAVPTPVAVQAAKPAPSPKFDEVSRTLRDQQSRLSSLKY